MNDNDMVHSDVLNYFSAEFDSLQERLKSGLLEDYRERVLVSQKIGEAVHLLSPYVRSDARARRLVRTGEALQKELLSVRERIVKQILQHKECPSLLQALMQGRGGELFSKAPAASAAPFSTPSESDR